LVSTFFQMFIVLGMYNFGHCANSMKAISKSTFFSFPLR
jgi:hypothetical protein